MGIIVTDPTKRVTDGVLLAELARKKIAAQGVALVRDYARDTPYAKFYKDLNSDIGFMVISQLPMCDADGIKNDVRWQVANPGEFREVHNLFNVCATSTGFSLVCRNNQPDGRKVNDTLNVSPKLIIDGKTQATVAPVLLSNDPLNSTLSFNVLLWDYGVVKRLLRLVEGRIHGYWLRPVDFMKEIHVVYNQSGAFRLKLSSDFAINEDEERIPLLLNSRFPLPRLRYNGIDYYLISDSSTFYPDANPETSSVDGNVYRGSPGTWASVRTGVGTVAIDSSTSGSVVQIASQSSPNWLRLVRAIYVFNLSGLIAIAQSAVLSLYGQGKGDDFTPTLAPNVNIYSSSPASNTELVANDYNIANWGATPLCDVPKAYNDWSIIGYNDFVLNAAGLAVLQAALIGDGIVKLGARNANYDVANLTPTYNENRLAYLQGYFAEQGAGYKPKLVITYSWPTAVWDFFTYG